jgi:hypothetical protein
MQGSLYGWSIAVEHLRQVIAQRHRIGHPLMSRPSLHL